MYNHIRYFNFLSFYLMFKFLNNLFKRDNAAVKKLEYFSVYPWVPMDESYLKGLNVKKEMPIVIPSYQDIGTLYPFNTADGREGLLFQTQRWEVYPVIFPIILEDEGFKLSYIDKNPVNDILFYKQSSLTGEDRFGVIKFFNQDGKLFARWTKALYTWEVVHKYPVDNGVVMRRDNNLLKVDISPEGKLIEEFFEEKVTVNPEVITVFPGEAVAQSVNELGTDELMIGKIDISRLADLFAMVFKVSKEDSENIVVEVFEWNKSHGVFNVLKDADKVEDQLIQDTAFWRKGAKMGVVKFFVWEDELRAVVIPPVYEGKEIVGKNCYLTRGGAKYKLDISPDWNIKETKI